MRALKQIGYGEILENVKISEVDKPTINKDDVLIENYAAAVNPLDIKIVKGDLKAVRKLSFPNIMGHDVSGKVIEKGENVTGFDIGDEVYAYVGKQGAFAEYVSINQNELSLKPNNISFEEAASLPLVGLAATQVLKRAKLLTGQSILIHAGSGGVGSMTIQLAKEKGAYVYTTTSTENVEWVKALGADRVIDYKKEDYKTIVKDVDMVLDTLGNEYTEEAFSIIKKRGKVISLVGPVDKETANRMKFNVFVKAFLAFKRRKITKQIKEKSAYYSVLFMRANVNQLNEVAKLVEAGKIKTNIDKVFPLEQALDALQYVNQGRTKGKVVIKIK